MIGRFSCLACADTATITSYYEGTKYTYIMYKNGGGINIDKVNEVKGDFKNGLEVSITTKIKNCDELKQALEGICLFENVHVEYKGEHLSYRSLISKFNERKIYTGDHFCICDILHDTYFKLGNVLYPAGIDLNIMTDLVIKLPMGSVDIIPNREALQYTSRTLKIIKENVENVKKELQEIMNVQASKNYTLKEFNETFNNYYFLVNLNNINFSIDKSDVKLNSLHATIDNNPVPDNFISFLNKILSFSIEKDDIYKSYNLASSNRGRSYFSMGEIIKNTIEIYVKKDLKLNNWTLQYYIDNCKSSHLFILKEFGIQGCKLHFKTYLINRNNSSIDLRNIDECLDFLFNHLNIKEIRNSDVPANYIDYYKKNYQTKKSKVKNDKISIRTYCLNGYSLSELNYLKNNSGIYLYSINTKDDKYIKEVADLVIGIPNISKIFTIKKEDLKAVENSKRFIKIENFLYSKNSILSNLFTGFIIYAKFREYDKEGIYTDSLPLYQEFASISKYYKYRSFYNRNYCNSLKDGSDYTISNKLFNEIFKLYKENNWLNNADIEYFQLNDEEIKAYHTYKKLLSDKYYIINKIACKKLGVFKKIGLNLPVNCNKLNKY